MQYYKINESVYASQIKNLNNSWIIQHRANNPQDTITQRYVEEFVWFGFGYVIKDSVTEQYITDFVELVEELPEKWHEEKPIKLKQTKNGVLWGIMNIPQISSGLAIYRQDNNIATYEEGDSYYFYLNFLLEEHKNLFNFYPNLEITIEEFN